MSGEMFTAGEVLYQLAAAGDECPRTTTIELKTGDACWNPASTKSLLYGPSTVTFTQHAHGGIDVDVREH